MNKMANHSDYFNHSRHIIEVKDEKKWPEDFLSANAAKTVTNIVNNSLNVISGDQSNSNDVDNDIQIVDVIVPKTGCNLTNSKESCIMSINEESQNNSSFKNFIAVDDIQKNKNSAVSTICDDVEIISEMSIASDSCKIPSSLCVNDSNEECITIKIDEECNSAEEMFTNSSEKYYNQNALETMEIKEQELSTKCNYSDTIDETNENACYEIEYDLNHTPTQITGAWQEFTSCKNNFMKGCKWAPDGSCILTCSDDNKLRLFNLPAELWDFSLWSEISELKPVLKIPEGGVIYDYCWYPLMNSNDAATCCLASTSRKSTVHLWDAYTGELRCSYRSYNHLDELATPHSISFDTDGEKLYCGFKNTVRIFDVSRPGREFEERQLYAYKTGQCGIISCFAFTSVDKNISAAGSYQRTIGLYAEPNGEFLCLLEGQGNGLTHLQFSPDGKYLYSGGRKDPEILCWDIRNFGKVLFSLRRSCETNQRMYFDISRCGKYVVSGNDNGVITFWDVTNEPKVVNEDGKEFSVQIPIRYFIAHDDCVNGISLHPSCPLLCSSSGQRKFPVLLGDDTEAIFSSKIEKEDNSLRLWWLGKLNKCMS